jgi:hypothetical protein
MFTQLPSDQINGSTNIKSQTTKVPASPVKINKNEQKKNVYHFLPKPFLIGVPKLHYSCLFDKHTSKE